MKLVHKHTNIQCRIKEGLINPLFFALIISFSCLAQEQATLSLDLFNFNHNKLNKDLVTLRSEDQIFYTNKITFLNILFNETAVSEDIITTYEYSIDQLTDLTFKQPELKEYYIGEAQLILSLIHVKLGNQMSSAKYFIKAYNSFERNLEAYPTLKDPEVAMKFMEISASILPKSLQWITSWFGVESNKQQAIKDLRTVYRSDQLSALTKTQCYALNLYLKLQFDIEVVQESSNTNVVLYDLLQAQLYGKQKQYKQMIESLGSIPDALSLKHFLLGKAYFITEHPECQSTLETFISSTKTTNNVSAAYFYLYQLNVLHDQDNTTNKAHTLTVYPQQNFRDKWAKSEIKQDQTADFITLRNAFDRGDYLQCIKHIQEKPEPQIREQYYLTNSYIKLDSIEKAKTAYNILVNMEHKNTYYIPKTGLNLAFAIRNDDPELAKRILKELKSFKNYPYEKEIEAKSELLLKSL